MVAGPAPKPCGTPLNTSFQLEHCPFSTIHAFYLITNSESIAIVHHQNQMLLFSQLVFYEVRYQMLFRVQIPALIVLVHMSSCRWTVHSVQTPLLCLFGDLNVLSYIFVLCYEGVVKSIGVSNYTCNHLSELLQHCRFKPAVLQVCVSLPMSSLN